MLAKSFLAAAAPAVAAELDEMTLEAQLMRWITRVSAARPAIAVDAAALVAQLASRLRAPAELAKLLDGAHGDDLYVAFAAARGDAAAVATIEAILVAELPSWLARLGADDAELAEVRQALRCKLLVAPPGTPARIGDYAGRGPLGAWLRVVALHTALDLRRYTPDGRAHDDAELAVEVTPELTYLKHVYGRELQQAFDTAMGALSLRQRNLLRLHHLDGLSTPEMGAILRVHRTTVRRQLDEAHALIAAGVRGHLTAQLAVDASDVESLIRLAESRIDVRLAGALKSDAG